MTCSACTAASRRPTHEFRSTCRGCMARSLSRSPSFAESRKSGKQTSAYQRALVSMGLLHADVIEASKADALGKAWRP